LLTLFCKKIWLHGKLKDELANGKQMDEILRMMILFHQARKLVL
jgi:hypothetical protein